jgi:hypothetical protein
VEACESIGKKQALRIPEATIERDYCLAWLLCAMTQHPVLSEALAFKGGTALRRIHFGDYRFSEDLDFTLVGELELDVIFAAFDELFERLREASGIQFQRSKDESVRHVRNDTFYCEFQGPLPARNPGRGTSGRSGRARSRVVAEAGEPRRARGGRAESALGQG